MGIGRAMWRRRTVIGLAAVASAALIAVNGGAVPTGASTPAPTASLASYSASYGFTGHAGLYAYGMGFDPTDNTILVGDLWNYVVKRFTESGGKATPFVVSKIAPRGALYGIGAPFGVAADNAGNVWVADQSNSRVVEFSHTGQWIQTIGSGGGPNPGENYPVGCGNGKMTIPTHLVLDSSGNIYVSDPRCRAVYVFNNTGTYLRTFQWSIKGTPIPRGVGMDSAGNVYVAEFNTRKIYVFNQLGSQLRVFQGAPNGTDMADVRGIAVDNVNQRVYAIGAENNKVVVFSTSGSYLATWSSAGATNFSSIRFVTTDQVGNVYVSDLYGYVVWKFDKNGNVLPWSTAPAGPPPGGWNQNNGVAVDPSTGYLYAVDTFGNRVQVFRTLGGQSCPSKTNCTAFIEAFGQRGPLTQNSPNLDYPHVVAIGTQHDVWMDGTNSLIHWDISTQPPTFLGTQGVHGRQLAAFKNGPQGLQVATYGSNPSAIYTVDTGNCRVQIFDYSGNLLQFMGGCGSGPDQMNAPRQLVVDGANHVYVADTGHNRVVEYDATTAHVIATFTTAAGQHLSQPRGVALNGGWLYVADSNNNRIVRVLASGMPSSSAALVTTGSDDPQGGFGGPEWMAFGPDGRLFVSDNNHTIYAFTITG